MTEHADAVRFATRALDELVAIRSISTSRAHDADVLRAGRRVAELLREAGLPSVELAGPSHRPAVIGRSWTTRTPGRPLVLLYAHYDVVGPGDERLWRTPPFVATERSGLIFGRGVADDKAAVAMHLATVAALAGDWPVDVSVLIEGEEETGSTSLLRAIGAIG